MGTGCQGIGVRSLLVWGAATVRTAAAELSRGPIYRAYNVRGSSWGLQWVGVAVVYSY